MSNTIGCELCGEPANLYCESDRASLCWACDNKVHGANFLVANHNRCVLCHNCQATTPWTASGPQLPHSKSLCLSCVSSHNNHGTTQVSVQQSSVNNHLRDDEDNDNDNDDESSLYEDNEEDYENQVVPPLSLRNNNVTPLISMGISDCSRDDEAEEEDDNSHILMVLPSSSLKRKRDILPTT